MSCTKHAAEVWMQGRVAMLIVSPSVSGRMACKWTHILQGHAKLWETAGSTGPLFNINLKSKLFLNLQ